MTIHTTNTSQHSAPIPLTSGQQQWWLLHQLQPGNASHHITFPVRLLGEVNLVAIKNAINEVHRRHDILRTTIATENGEPRQTIAPFEPRELNVVDLQHLPHTERFAAAQKMAEEDAHLAFEMERDWPLRTSLLRLAPDDYVWLRTMHHVAGDGWSLDLLLRELAVCYNAFLSGEEIPLPAPRISHADFARRQSQQENQQQQQLDYWKAHLEGCDVGLELPTDRARPAVQTHRGAHLYFHVSPQLEAELQALGRAHGATLFMTLLAAFSVLLHRHGGQQSINIGTAIANRNTRDSRDLMGYLVNTSVLKNDLSGNPTFGEMIARAKNELLGAFTHPDVPFRRLVEELVPRRDPSQNPLFQAFLVAVPLIRDHKMSGLGKELLTLRNDATMYDVLLQIITREHDRDKGLALKLEYSTDLFDAETAQRMIARFLRLLEGAVENPQLPISDLPFLPDEELAQLEKWSEGERAEYSVSRLETLVQNQIDLTPNAIAIEDENGQSLTYRELGERAGVLASRLQAMGAKADERVAICLERTLDLPIAVLAVLQAGAAYVPLDASYPVARLRDVLADAAPCAFITTRELAARFENSHEDGAPQLPLVFLDDATAASSAPSTPAWEYDAQNDTEKSGDDLAYLLYTSGSTGKPKGVAMPHHALANLVQWQNAQSSAYGNLSPRTLQFSPLGFDVSFQEIFATLSSGGTLVLISEDARRDPFALLEVLVSRKIERLFLPFVALQQLAFAASRRQNFPIYLREIASAGEALLITPEVRELFANLPHCVLHNHYGPTETHVVTSATLTGNPKTWPQRPTIGAPIANARIQILSSEGQLAPINAPGELVIGSTPVARGYWNRPDLTVEKFTDHGYKTGDIARWKNDGTLELFGRSDAQIKVRGFRVELGEIESALLAISEVRETVVIAESESSSDATAPANGGLTSGETRLIACIVAENAGVGINELRRVLREKLPEYMIPAEFVFVAGLPLTPSGKLDRNALQALRGVASKPEYSAPQNDVERMLARIWGEILGAPRVGRTDNFFDLGGHSRLTNLVVSRIRDEMKIEMPLHFLFESPTIEQFASRLETSSKGDDEMDFDDFEDGRI